VGRVLQNAFDGFRRADGQGGFLHNNFVALCDFRDATCAQFHVFQIRRFAFPHPIEFGGGVDRDEDNVRVTNVGIHIGGEKEVAVAVGFNHFLQPGFEDRKVIRVPCRNAGLVDIHDIDRNVRALVGNHGHGGTADVTGANAAYLHKLFSNRAVQPWLMPRPPIPLVLVDALPLGRSLRTSRPVLHISLLAMVDSSFSRTCL
jgi:hypothetical protein